MSWTIEELEKKRQITDPLADETIAKIFKNDDVIAVNKFFRQLIKNTELPLEEMPSEIKEYLSKNSTFPSYTNWDLVKKGEKVFLDYGPEIGMMLMAKSLPTSYACAKGAEVLHSTGRLDETRTGGLEKFTRRLMETSQFVIDIGQSNGLSEGGKGIRSAQKVRLMHGSIRYFLKKKGWDVTKYDEPINQEDMAGTLMDFAVYPIEGLEQMGISVSSEEKEAYYHLWRVVGHFMGVQPDLIPETYAKGLELAHLILKHQVAPSEAGVELTDACIKFLQKITPGNIFDFYPSVLVRYLVGDKIADILQVKKNEEDLGKLMNRVAFFIFGTWTDLEDESLLIRKLSRKFNAHLLQGIINYFNHNKQINFEIPPSLRENWIEDPIKSNWEDLIATPSILSRRIAIQKKIKD